MSERLTPEDRTAQLMEAAITVASKGHYRYLRRKEIAGEAGISGPLVQHYLGPMVELPNRLMKYAVDNNHAWVVAQGLLDGNLIALAAPEALKVKARGVFQW